MWLSKFILNATPMPWVKCFNRPRMPNNLFDTTNMLASSLSPLLSAIKIESTTCTQINHTVTVLYQAVIPLLILPWHSVCRTPCRSISGRFPPASLSLSCAVSCCCFVIKLLNHSVSPCSRSVSFGGNCAGVLRTLQFP